MTSITRKTCQNEKSSTVYTWIHQFKRSLWVVTKSAKHFNDPYNPLTLQLVLDLCKHPLRHFKAWKYNNTINLARIPYQLVTHFHPSSLACVISCIISSENGRVFQQPRFTKPTAPYAARATRIQDLDRINRFAKSLSRISASCSGFSPL